MNMLILILEAVLINEEKFLTFRWKQTVLCHGGLGKAELKAGWLLEHKSYLCKLIIFLIFLTKLTAQTVLLRRNRYRLKS